MLPDTRSGTDNERPVLSSRGVLNAWILVSPRISLFYVHQGVCQPEVMYPPATASAGPLCRTIYGVRRCVADTEIITHSHIHTETLCRKACHPVNLQP
jgi:hypothetical protein